MDLKYSIREPMAPGKTLSEKFDALAELGFSGIEITGSSERAFAEEIRKASGTIRHHSERLLVTRTRHSSTPAQIVVPPPSHRSKKC